MRIFIVEDHEDTLVMFSTYLRRLGHTVSVARSLHDAVEKLPSSRPDLIISDVNLPDGEGWDLPGL